MQTLSRPVVEPERALVIGLGSMGKRYASLLTRLGFVEPSGLYLCDKNIKSNTEFACAHMANTLDEILMRGLNDGGFDIIIIATPADTHLDILAKVAEWCPFAGILIEKPLTDGALCEHPKVASLLPELFTRPIAVGYNWRFHPFAQRIKEISPALRDITLYVADEMDHWPGKYGNPLTEFSHEFDLIRFWTRSPIVTYVNQTDDGYVVRGNHFGGKWSVRIRPHHQPRGRWVKIRLPDNSRLNYPWDTSLVEETYQNQLTEFVNCWATTAHISDLTCPLVDGLNTALFVDNVYEILGSERLT